MGKNGTSLLRPEISVQPAAVRGPLLRGGLVRGPARGPTLGELNFAALEAGNLLQHGDRLFDLIQLLSKIQDQGVEVGLT
jgi:hypothetical protein